MSSKLFAAALLDLVMPTAPEYAYSSGFQADRYSNTELNTISTLFYNKAL
jgi:hypothetical protein